LSCIFCADLSESPCLVFFVPIYASFFFPGLTMGRSFLPPLLAARSLRAWLPPSPSSERNLARSRSLPSLESFDAAFLALGLCSLVGPRLRRVPAHLSRQARRALTTFFYFSDCKRSPLFIDEGSLPPFFPFRFRVCRQIDLCTAPFFAV